MKLLIPAIAMLALGASAQTLKPGSEVTPEAIAEATFVKGSAPANWEPGKLYILECWATWCGPCLISIPHIDKLHDKFHDKGLRVIGMNVLEDDMEKVAKFVESQGDDMSFPVAFVGKDGAFHTDWLTAAGIRGIPHSFIVRDGKLLLTAHPASLTDEAVTKLLAGGEVSDAEVARIQASQKNSGKLRDLLKAFSAADRNKDGAAMLATIEAIHELDPQFVHLNRMRVDQAMVVRDWDAASKHYDAIGNPKLTLMCASVATQRIEGYDELPPASFMERIAGTLREAPDEDAVASCSLASILWRLGRKEEALEAAQSAIPNRGLIPKDLIEGFARSFADGEPQSVTELMAAVRKAK